MTLRGIILASLGRRERCVSNMHLSVNADDSYDEGFLRMLNGQLFSKSQAAVMLLVCILLAHSANQARARNTKTSGPPDDSTFPSLVQDDLELLQEETVSIASRYAQPISEAPSNVYVITEEDIRRSGATDIPTLLRGVPGMEVMQTTGAEYNVSVRGDNQLFSNKLLVQVDGRSVYIDGAGHVSWRKIPVTLSEIERIEILKGPAGYIHGFNAFDGVINIITKSPFVQGQNAIQVAGGEFGTFQSTALLGGVNDQLGYRLSVGYDQNQQWRNRNGLAFRNYQVNGHTEYRFLRGGKLTASGGWMDNNKFDGKLSSTTRDVQKDTLGYTRVGYQTSHFQAQAFWNGIFTKNQTLTNPRLNGLLEFLNPGGGNTTKTSMNTYDIMAQYSHKIGSDHQAIIGANYRYNTMATDFFGRFGEEHRFGVYLQDTWSPVDSLSASLGVRYDLDTFINPTISPRGAVIWNFLPDHSLRASIAIGYRPPTLIRTYLESSVLFNIPPAPFVTPFQGSENLKPEQIISYELEYQGWYWKHRLRVRSSFFYNHISDLVDFVPTGPAPTDPVTASNNGEADIFGGELGLEYWVTPWLSGFVNGAFQEIGQTIRGVNERAGPRFKINGGLRAQSDLGLSGEALIHFVSAVTYPLSDVFTTLAPLGASPPDARLDPYTLVNVRVGYSFWKDRAEAAVSVFNALNDKHREHPLGDTIKSRVLGWLTLHY